MTGIQDAFIEIIGYCGFNISRQLVIDFQAARQKKNDNNRKPVIGIHFRDGCCLKDGQIVKYATPQYTSIFLYNNNHMSSSNWMESSL